MAAVSLDDLGFIALGLTPEAMGKGNWSVGLVTDERASTEQRAAIAAIASGAAGDGGDGNDDGHAADHGGYVLHVRDVGGDD